MLYILHNTEDGLCCDAIEKSGFDQWLKDHTDGIKPEYQPKFIRSVPNSHSDVYEFFVIDGQVAVPTPVEIVRTYKLP